MNFNELSFNHLSDNIIHYENEPIPQNEDEYVDKIMDKFLDNKYEGRFITDYNNNSKFVPDYTFIGNENINTLYINDIQNIGTGAFENCTNLEKITNGTGYIQVHNSSFANCIKLVSVPICINTASRCFYNCTSLKEISLAYETKIIEKEAFCNCDSLVKINGLSNISYIGVRAFYNNYNLRNIVLPNTLEIIDSYAFSKCNLHNIIIPRSVKYIETEAFSNNIGLSEVIFLHTEEDVLYFNNNVFENCPNIIIKNKNNNSCITNYANKNDLSLSV